MTQEPISLAQHIAGFAAAMGSMAKARAWRGEMAYALILARLAATLGCLAILAAQWEASRETTHPQAGTARTPRARTVAPGIPTPELRPKSPHLPPFRPAPSRAPPPTAPASIATAPPLRRSGLPWPALPHAHFVPLS